MSGTPRHVHVPGPGDVFSADSRSAVLIVARQLAAAHQRAGGAATLVAARGVLRPDWDGPPAVAALRGRIPATRAARVLDAGAGRVLGVRPLAVAAYRGLATAGDDVVLLHAHPPAVLARGVAGTRVLYVHNDAFASLGRREGAAVGRAADAVVSVSADLASRFPPLAAPVLVVPNGVDLTAFTPPPPGALTGLRPRLVFVGRVIPEKGVHVLLEAAGALRHLAFDVDVIGSSGQEPLSDYERRLRADLHPGLGERVRFLRDLPRRDLGARLRTGHVMVVPSVWREPLGLVVGEGIASGMAVVASRAGGIPEIGGDACAYVEPGDAAGLAAALEPLLTDPTALAAARAASLARRPALSWDLAHEKLVAGLAAAR